MLNISKLLYVRNDKIDKKGKVPIYLRLSENGAKVEISIKEKIKPEKWDSSRQCCIGKEHAPINQKIERLLAKVVDLENKYLLEDNKPSLSRIKAILVGKKEIKSVLSHWDKHLSRIYSLVGKDYSISTYKKYRTTMYHFRDFINEKLDAKDVSFSDLNFNIISEFRDYLKIEKNLSHNTVIKYMKNFKVVVDDARKRRWLNYDPFDGVKMKYKELDIQFLTSEELQLLEEKEFEIDRLRKIKDFFLFSCYTGLSFSDISTLTSQNILEFEGVKLIDKRRCKTDVRSLIPLHDKAITLLNKYNYADKNAEELIFPIPSNQKYNAYLKEIADICGIRKAICTHDARRTFATTFAMDKGVSMEGVSKMLGHSTTASTKRYAKITQQKVIEEMRRAGNL